jgi:uncharacterized membrane protein YkoI
MYDFLIKNTGNCSYYPEKTQEEETILNSLGTSKKWTKTERAIFAGLETKYAVWVYLREVDNIKKDIEAHIKRHYQEKDQQETREWIFEDLNPILEKIDIIAKSPIKTNCFNVVIPDFSLVRDLEFYIYKLKVASQEGQQIPMKEHFHFWFEMYYPPRAIENRRRRKKRYGFRS